MHAARKLAVCCLLFVEFVLPLSAKALPEICGNGYDDDGVGGDLLCPEPDKDNDGYRSVLAGGDDCDDTTYKIFPGVATNSGCAANQWRRCGTDGTFSACSSSVLCEAVAGSTCKYIDCAAGSDTTGNGSFSSPWKSFGMVGYRVDGTQNPPGWYSVRPGDVVYLVGSGTCSDYYNLTSGEPNTVIGLGAGGEPGKPITFKRYPGSTAVIDPPFTKTQPGTVISLRSANYVRIEDLDLTGSYSPIIYGGPNHDIEISRIRCHDSVGNNDNNLACINLAAAPANIYVHHSEIFNIYDPDKPGEQNVGLVVLFQGQNNRFEYNRFFYTNSPAYGGPIVGRCLRYKHPGSAGTFVVKGNQFWNCNNYAVENSTHGIRMTENLLVNSENYLNGSGYICNNVGSSVAYCRDGLVENNTFVNARAMELPQTAFDANLGSTIYRNNVVLHRAASYGSENGMLRIARYGTDADVAQFNSVQAISSSSNCYYNPMTPIKIDFFADDPATTGGFYSFAQWQALGRDSGSVEQNPLFDEFFRPTSAGCLNKGWRGAVADVPAPPTGIVVNVVP